MYKNLLLKSFAYLFVCFLIGCNTSNTNNGRWEKVATTGSMVYLYNVDSILRKPDHIEVLLKIEFDLSKDPNAIKKFIESRKEYDMPVAGFEHYKYQVQKVYFNCSEGKCAITGYTLYDDNNKALETKDFPLEWTPPPAGSVMKIAMDDICKREKR